MRKKILMLFLAVMFVVPMSVHADECSQEELSTYKQFAKNIKEKVEYVGNGKYKVSFLNIPSDLFVTDYRGYDYYSEKEYNDIFVEGYTYDFSILTRNDKCYATILEKRDIKMPAVDKKVENEKSFFEKNMVYIISGGVVLIAAVTVTIIIISKKRKKAIL